MSLLDKLKKLEFRDMLVPAAGILSVPFSIAGGAVAAHLAESITHTPEINGTYQVVGNWIGGFGVLGPVYIYDCFKRYTGKGAKRFFIDQAKIGIPNAIWAGLTIAKPFISGQMIRRGVDPVWASIIYDVVTDVYRVIAINGAYLNNILNLKLDAKKKVSGEQ
jgi:hypothetical protein